MIKKGQSILGYVVLIVIIIIALIAMRPYLRNAISGKIREAGDAFGGGEVYVPQGLPNATTITTNF